ncbi:ABC transporter permease [Nocardia sp. X0981]
MFEAFPDQSTRPAGSWPGIFALTIGLPIVIALMLFAFLAPSFGSGPKDLPLAISGPENAVPKLTQSIEDRSPDAFEIRALDNGGAVQAAVRDREAVGGIAIDPADRTTTIYTAAGNGTPYAALLHNIAAGMKAQGQDVEIIDLAPLTEDDPTGAGLAALGLPLAFGGMASAAILILLFAGRPWHTLTGALAISIAAGFVVAAILQYGYRSMDTDYFAAAIAIAAGIAATSLLVTGLGALIGLRAIGIGAIFTIFVSNPLSGLATGWWWLPKPWGEIGQYLPIGSAGHLLRSIAFFDGNGAGRAWAVLLTWMVIGIALNAYGGIRHRATNNPENENLERVNA